MSYTYVLQSEKDKGVHVGSRKTSSKDLSSTGKVTSTRQRIVCQADFTLKGHALQLHSRLSIPTMAPSAQAEGVAAVSSAYCRDIDHLHEDKKSHTHIPFFRNFVKITSKIFTSDAQIS
jgi:hypothetical protein